MGCAGGNLERRPNGLASGAFWTQEPPREGQSAGEQDGAAAGDDRRDQEAARIAPAVMPAIVAGIHDFHRKEEDVDGWGNARPGRPVGGYVGTTGNQRTS